VEGNKYLLVIVDSTTKFAIAIWVEGISAEIACRTIVRELIRRLVPPFIIFTDNGGNFTNDSMNQLKIIDIIHKLLGNKIYKHSQS
jgi:hypothetical protein